VKPLFQILFFLTLQSFAFARESSLETDSLPTYKSDALRSQWQKMDSIKSGFNSEADSIQNDYRKSMSALGEEQLSLNHQIDSLNKRNLPADHLTARLDSLQGKRNEITSRSNAKLAELKAKTAERLGKIETTPEMEGPFNEFKNKMNGITIADNTPIKIPPLEIPGLDMQHLNVPLKDMQGLPAITTPSGDIAAVTGELQNVTGDVKTLASGDLNNIENLSTVQKQAENIDAVKTLQDGSNVAGTYQQQVADLSNPDVVKEKAVEAAQKQAVNHFAGKEEVLKEAMDKVAKLKRKYPSVTSINDLPKRKPNAMKDKPFIERLVPGVYLQYQHKHAYLIDVNPYAAYRISGRFSSGLGWNQRFVNTESSKLNKSNYRIFGPRVFVDAGIGRGFIVHVETELMNTFVPSKLTALPEQGNYQWVSATMIGIKKQYKIYKNLNGIALMQYNLYNKHFKAPYVDRLNSRIGFEYVLKPKAKKK
jgi:hypothetical protein